MRVTRWAMVTVAICGIQSAYAGENITFSNCLKHVGGGGFGAFDCYEAHVKSLEADNKKILTAVKLASAVSNENRIELEQYMRAQDDAAKACNLAINIEYPSQKEREQRSHIELYDVMAARCRYSIRKQQNDFLRDLQSITGN